MGRRRDHRAASRGRSHDFHERLLFAGPLSGSERGRLRVLLIVDAHTESEVHHRLADDPWTISRHLTITSVEPWNVFVGAERLGAAHGARNTAGADNVALA